jgi:predicted DCC family thiol-disulfide oxidoreductase YuxK
MAAAQAIVLYDGLCRFCGWSVRALKRLDWLGRLRYQDARDVAHLPACAEPLDPRRLLEEMHVVTPDGRRALHGYRAVRWLAWRFPFGWPVAPFLYLPGIPWLGNKAYLWIARHRHQLVPCKDGVCTLPGMPTPGGDHEQPAIRGPAPGR